MQPTYLGFDFSTQQIKAVVISSCGHVIHVTSVLFDTDLPEFGTVGGINKHPDGHTVTAPVLMWVKALDLLLNRMSAAGVKFSDVAAISGAGQQHGSVYWRDGSESILQSLNSDKLLFDQLQHAFSITDSPIWMDSSTAKQCTQLEQAVGGAKNLCSITGSRAYHRFTGNQIAKISENQPDEFRKTARISLVSSFACSLFLGRWAPIDFSDGSGMNLLDIRSHSWNNQCLNACGDNLAEKLSQPVPTTSSVGFISDYFVKRYGFSDKCTIFAFTGDNPSSMAGVNQGKDDIAVSLGTSDTVFVWLQQPVAHLNVHCLCNPVDPQAYMGMLCFKNGALTRERIRKLCACSHWDEFNDLLSNTPPGNSGNVGFYFDFPEILPQLEAGDYRFDRDNQLIDSFIPAVEARAVIESQCLRMKLHATNLGCTDSKRVIVTGGGAVNQQILQILADVFAASVYTLDVQHSAALGGAWRAMHGMQEKGALFKDVCNVTHTLLCRPTEEHTAVYAQLLERYKCLEEKLVKHE